MKKLKKQKGITLIALIITIIVMLILVAVTINVALNGGLFGKATKAKEDTQRETDKEQLLAAVIGALNNDGTVNEAELQAHLPDEFEYISAKNVYKNTVTGKEYTINLTTGKVTEVTSSNSGSSETQSGSENTGNTEPAEGTYVITVADIGEQGMFNGRTYYVMPYTKLINSPNSEDLKSIMTQFEEVNLEGDIELYYFNNIECSDNSLDNLSSVTYDDIMLSDDDYYHISYAEALFEGETHKYFIIQIKKDGVQLTDQNYTSDVFNDLTFTISE